MGTEGIIEEHPGLYRIIGFKVLRRMAGAFFDEVPLGVLPSIDAVDRVIHYSGTVSPGPVGEVARPWYMHLYQSDHLIVVHGMREIDIYTPAHGKVEHFTAEPNRIFKNGELIHDGPGMLVWPEGVFHRIKSDPKLGSASINLASHTAGFDIRTNFSVYDVNLDTGEYWVVREGHLDQQGS